MADEIPQPDRDHARVVFYEVYTLHDTYLTRVVYVNRWVRSVESRYIVSSGVHNYGRGARQLGFSVHALSKTLGPDEICSRIDAFLPQFREILRSMSKEVEIEWRGIHVQGVGNMPSKCLERFAALFFKVFFFSAGIGTAMFTYWHVS